MNKPLKAAVRHLPLILFIFAIVFACYTGYVFASNFVDSDMSSQLVLGNLLAEQNKIVTTDFAYSTELIIFNYNVVFMLLFKLFSNWFVVRYAGMLVMQAMLIVSYLYLSRQMKMSVKAFFLSAALMLLPVNILYGRFALYQSYYTICFVYSFLIAGLFLAVIQAKKRQYIRQSLRLAALAVLVFMSCINGMRQFPATMIPLALAALTAAVKSRRDTHVSLADVPKPQWIPVALVGAMCVVGFAGLLIHNNVLSKIYTFRLMSDSTLALPTAEHFRDLLVGYLSLFGFQEGRTLFSLEGLVALSGVFAAVLFAVIGCAALLAPKTDGDHPKAIAGLVYPLAMIAMTVLFILVPGNENYPQYYLPVFIWFFPYLGLLIDQTPVSVRSLTSRQALIWLACLCMAVNGVFYNLYFLQPDDKQVTYDINIPYDTAPSLEAVSQFLIENEYEVGYASFWLANVMTELTDGQIRMISVSYDYSNPGEIYYYNHLTSRQTREKEFVEGKSIFFLVANVELDLFNQSELVDYAIQVYADRNVRVFYFDFDTEVWDYMLQQAIDSNQTAVLEQLLEE